jgi:membrane-associated phospholipid phosphatase
MAVTTGILRVASDQHWLSDVLAAQAIGATLGFVLPTLIYYDSDQEAPGSDVQPPSTPPAPVFLSWHTVF